MTKIHLIINAHVPPIVAELSGGEVSDLKGFDALGDDDLPEARVSSPTVATIAITFAV